MGSYRVLRGSGAVSDMEHASDDHKVLVQDNKKDKGWCAGDDLCAGELGCYVCVFIFMFNTCLHKAVFRRRYQECFQKSVAGSRGICGCTCSVSNGLIPNHVISRNFLYIPTDRRHSCYLAPIDRSTNRYGKQVKSLVSANDNNITTHLHLCLWVDASATSKRYSGQAFVHFGLRGFCALDLW